MFEIRLSLICVIVLAGVVSNPIVGNANQDAHSDANTLAFAYLPKEQYLVGEPIPLRVEAHNLDSQPVYVRNNRGHTFVFSARHSSGKIAKDIRPAQISIWSSLVPVEPGRDFNDVFFLNEYLEFRDPGQYAISYSGRLPIQKTAEYLHSTDPNWHAVMLSGTLEVTLRRGSADELEKALRAYLKPLRSNNYRLGRRAARALIVSEPTLAVKLLREALNVNESTEVPSGLVAWALARMRTDEAIETLREFATDPNSRGRLSAISELGRFRIKEGKPTLIGLLSDENPRVRVGALRALRHLADKSTIPQIEARLTDPDEKVREAAEKALKALTKDRGDK
jgi:hypothetical protein